MILILPLSCLLFSFASSVTGQDEEEYKYLDKNGNEVVLPTGRPIYSKIQPGPWRGLEDWHDPQVTWKTRKDGLETIRRLLIRVPHPMKIGDPNRLQALYLVDKDGLIVGYHAFGLNDTEATAEMQINGVINYVLLYVDCKEHGLWRKGFRFL